MSNGNEIIGLVRRSVEAEGLAFLGVAALGPEGAPYARFHKWLEDGRHAGMAYLAENRALREDPRALLPGARTAVVVGLGYDQGDKAPARSEATPRVAQYARLKDYHKVLWRKGEAILTALHAALGPDAVGRVVTDSAPLLERALAARAGAGFIGKNTCLIHPERGSFFLLGELLTSLELPLTEGPAVDPERRTAAGGCGTCRRCQVHCPTGALDDAYTLDANKCLAYWTIEHRGPIPERFWPWLKLYVFGCDICQLVCPYNRGSEPRAPAELVRVAKHPDLYEVATMTQADYERMFGGTPMTRAKRTGLVRNALIAMTVTHHARQPEAVAHARTHETDEVIRETLAQLERWGQAPLAT